MISPIALLPGSVPDLRRVALDERHVLGKLKGRLCVHLSFDNLGINVDAAKRVMMER
jgi:hypothetical protein